MGRLFVCHPMFELFLVVFILSLHGTRSQDVCTLPIRQGFCFGEVESYFYNTTSETCQQFIYSGCGGNENNFKTMDECVAACVPVCGLPPDVGPCTGYFPRYYYDRDSRQCRRLNYGGCDGNKNRFNTLEECDAACRCSTPKDTGPCLAITLRFHFDQVTRTCQEFNYGGCGGNGNNFEKLRECEQSCDPLTAAEKKKQREERQQQELQHQQQQQQQHQQQQQQYPSLGAQYPYPQDAGIQQLPDPHFTNPLGSWSGDRQFSSLDNMGRDIYPPARLSGRDWQVDRRFSDFSSQRNDGLRQRLMGWEGSSAPLSQSGRQFSSMDHQIPQTGLDILGNGRQFQDSVAGLSPLRDGRLRETPWVRRQNSRFSSDSGLFPGLRSFRQNLESSPLNMGRRIQPSPSRSRERCRWTRNGRMCFTPGV